MVHTTAFATPEPPPKAELGPDWSVAKQKWGLAWDIHWIGLGALFGLVALWSAAGLVLSRYRNPFARKPLFVAISVLLIILGVTRALYLCVDPYQSGENGITTVPPAVSQLLFGLAYPCLTSSFCLIHLAFLEVAKIKLPSRRLQKPRFLAAVIIIHFTVVLVIEITTALISTANWMLIACQSLFILWGLLLFISFIYSGGKLLYQTHQVRQRLGKLEGSGRSETREHRRTRSSTAKVARITMATSILGLACCALQTYSLFGVYEAYTKAVRPQPWPWWAFQTCFRLVELVMAGTIAYSVQHPSERARKVQPGITQPRTNNTNTEM